MWNHYIDRPALLWDSTDGLVPETLAALQAGRGDTVRLPPPAPAVLRSRLQDELAVSDRALRACTQTYERRRWAPGAQVAARRRPVARLRRLPRGQRRPRRPRPVGRHRRRLTVRHRPVPPRTPARCHGVGGPMARRQSPRPSPQRARLVRALAALALVLGLAPLTSPVSRAATLSGHDISWPQCPVVSRRVRAADAADDDPLRRRRARPRACRSRGTRVWPTRSRWVTVQRQARAGLHHGGLPDGRPARARTAPRGRGRPTRAGQLSNVGYAEATYASRS